MGRMKPCFLWDLDCLRFHSNIQKIKTFVIFSKSLKASSTSPKDCLVPCFGGYIFCLLLHHRYNCQVTLDLPNIQVWSSQFYVQIVSDRFAVWATENWVMPMLNKAVKRQDDRINQQGWLSSDQVASQVLPVQVKEWTFKVTQETCTIALTVLGHPGDLQGSDTEIFTFGYKCIEQNDLIFFFFSPATYLLISVTAERGMKSGTVEVFTYTYM